MLSRALALVLAAALAVALLLAGGQQAALAGGGPGTGPLRRRDVRAVVRAAVHGDGRDRPVGRHPGQPRHPGGQPAGGRDRRRGRGCGRLPGHGEQDVRLRPGGLPGHGADAGLPDRRAAPAAPAPGAGPAPPDPAVLAALARQTLGLPSPVIRSSPAQAALQLTNLPTWLWINPAEWVPESKTATVPGESVTATATPVSVTWHPGDGTR